MKYLAKMLLLTVVIVVSMSCTAPHDPQVLRVGIHTFPETLNPVYSTRETSQAVLNKIFDSLYCYDVNGDIVNGLAADAAVGQTGGGILIRLKDGVFFSGGKELTAEDVVRTVKLMKNPAFGYPYASDLDFIGDIREVDRYRIRLTLAGTVATWKKRLTFKVLNSRQLENPDPAKFRMQTLEGTGPYTIKTVNRPSGLVLGLRDAPGQRGNNGKNGGMYREIRYEVISYGRVGPLKLEADELDICEIQYEHVGAYPGSEAWQKRFRILKYRKFGYTYLVFNQKNMSIDENVKKIFYRLLMSGDFLDRFLKGQGNRLHTPFLLLNDKIKRAPVNWKPLKHPVRLKILTNSESKLRRKLVSFLRQHLEPFNIFVEPELMEYQSFLDYLKKGRFDIAISGYLFHIDNDMRDVLHSESYFNYAGYCSGEMDLLLDRGAAEKDSRQRDALYMKAHELWLKDLPLIPLFSLYYYVGVSRRIHVPAETYNVVSAEGDFLFNISQWRAGGAHTHL